MKRHDLLIEDAGATADLTPMLDTIFLIILLLLATLMNSTIVRGFPVNLPAFSEKTSVHKDHEPIEVSIDIDGRLYIGSDPVETDQAAAELKKISTQSSSSVVLLRADEETQYGRVAHILCHLSNQLPDRQIILVTRPLAKSKRGEA
jgi:biopolymer transport protein ExbD